MIDRARALSLGALGLVLALAYGIWYAYGVFMVVLLQEFGWSRSLLAGAFSVFTLVHGIANPLIGMLCDRLRPERLVAGGGVALGIVLWLDSFITTPVELYLFFGVFTALAVACCGWVPAVIQVQRRFPDRLGFALGIVSAGVGIGMMLVVPLCQWLIQTLGWRMAFRVLGVICTLVIVPAAMYLVRSGNARASAGESAGEPKTASPKPSAAARPAARSIRISEAMRAAPFWLIMAAYFFGSLSTQTMHVHQVAFLVDHGIAAMIAASVVGVVGGSSVIGKIGGGWLSEHIDREIIYVAGIVITVASVAALLVVGANPTTWGPYGYAVLLGLGYSVTAALTPALSADRFSGEHFGSIVGAGMFASAIGAAIGPWLAGLQFDLTGSYTLPFVVAAVCAGIAGAAVWIARRLRLQPST